MHRTFVSILIILTFVIGSRIPAIAFCFAEAGHRYGLSPYAVWGIAKTENPTFNVSAVNYNTNGTYDYGLMQINSIWEPALRKAGIPWGYLADPCTNVMAGAWILAQCVQQYGNTWQGIGCYHSRTPSKRDGYARKVAANLVEANLIGRR